MYKIADFAGTAPRGALTLSVIVQTVDTQFLQYTINKTLQKSASVHLLFGFEYVILASIVVSVFLKYSLSLVDAYFEGRWENKVALLTSKS